MTESKSGKGLRELEMPEKIYLSNPNLYYAMAEGREPDTGSMREKFLLNMLRAGHCVSVPDQGDFLVDEGVKTR
jgi:uncharacterized protein